MPNCLRGRASARRSRGNVAAVVFDRRQAGAQAGQRGVGLDMKAIDGQVRAVDQAVLPAQRDRPQEQPLKQLGVDEPPGLRVAIVWCTGSRSPNP